MFKVGIKDVNEIDLEHGQTIVIRCKETDEVDVEGVLKYVPGAFMIEREGTYDVLLYHYTENSALFEVRPTYIVVKP